MAPMNATNLIVMAYVDQPNPCDTLAIQAIRDMIREEQEKVKQWKTN